MKCLFWSKIPNTKIVSTIWMHVFTHPIKVDLKKLNEVFEDKFVEKQVENSKRKN